MSLPMPSKDPSIPRHIQITDPLCMIPLIKASTSKGLESVREYIQASQQNVCTLKYIKKVIPEHLRRFEKMKSDRQKHLNLAEYLP